MWSVKPKAPPPRPPHGFVSIRRKPDRQARKINWYRATLPAAFLFGFVFWFAVLSVLRR
jgi:hypothetical protein